MAGAASQGGAPIGGGGGRATGGSPGDGTGGARVATGGAAGLQPGLGGGSGGAGPGLGGFGLGGRGGNGGNAGSGTGIGGGAGSAGAGGAANGGAAAGGVGWGQVPAILSRIIPPSFPNVDCDITKYGGVADGKTDNTAAFAKAIADCSSKGGGRVVTPAGTFFTGPIELTSNINLYVASGATISFTTDPQKYLPNVEVSWAGSLIQNYRPLIWAHDATNVAITGPGTLDGNASRSNWYAWLQKEAGDIASVRTQNANGVPPASRIYGNGHFLRPALIQFMNCTNVLFDGFTANELTVLDDSYRLQHEHHREKLSLRQ